MKIVITGGAGYVGTSLAERLSNDDSVDEIIIFDNLVRSTYNFFSTPSINGDKIKFVRATILDNNSLASALAGADIIYHLAAKVVNPDSDADSHAFEQINNWGTATVVNEARKAGVKTFIYLSSVYVYGQGPEEKSVKTIPNPSSFYGISKLRGEDHVKTLPKSINTYIIRSGSIYGYNASTRFNIVINKLLFEAQFQNKIAILGEGNQIRPFIHIDKLTDVLTQLTNSTLTPGTYNVVEHNASIMNVVDELKLIYPNLEYTHVNRHISMKDIIVKPSNEILSETPWQPKEFSKEMLEFKAQLI